MIAPSVAKLYEALSGREEIPIRRAVEDFRREASEQDVFDALVRFAVLFYNSSEHGKHALLACHSARRLQAVFDSRFDDILTECAIYAANARLPWSEPAIANAPDPADVKAGKDEIEGAIRARDLGRAERWLAALLRENGPGALEPRTASRFFAAASMGFPDLGHGLIVAAAVWELAALYPPAAAYPVLRPALIEWCAHETDQWDGPAVRIDPADLLNALLDRVAADEGSPEAFHRIALFDAAIRASAASQDEQVLDRVCGVLAAGLAPAPSRKPGEGRRETLPIYTLAKDFGELLKAWAVAEEMRVRFPAVEIDSLEEHARLNLARSSFDQWSF